MKAMPIILLAALTTTACATTRTPPATARCDAAPVADLVGKPANSDLAADALKRSGARSIRWKAPGMAMTMDYRIDRLNIAIDDKNVVTGVDCG
jgi:hypothetical protein